MYSLALLVFACFLAVVQAQIPVPSKCSNMTTEKDFDLNKFQGKWFEQQRYLSLSEFSTRCNMLEIKELSDTKLSVIVRNVNFLNMTSPDVENSVSVENPRETGRMKIEFSYLSLLFPGTFFFTPAYFNVLDTDYRNYAIISLCQDTLFNSRFELVWVVTRRRTLDPKVWDAILQIVKTVSSVDRSKLQATDNSNCVHPDIKDIPS